MLIESKSETKSTQQQSVSFRWMAVVVFACALGATSFRVYHSHYPGANQIGNRNFGFCDFYNGIYYPTIAFLERDNPYLEDIVERYPISRHVPFFSPLVFVAHIPFALLPKTVGAVAFFVYLIALVLAISRLTLSVLNLKNDSSLVLLIAGGLLLTRPGHNSVFNGYFTLELAFGTLLALQFGRSRPWLAGIGLVIASFKPTFAIPLFLLMICRGHWRAAILGAAVSTIGAVAGLAWIAENQSLVEVYGFISDAQKAHHEFPNVWPVNTWTRVDLLAMVAKWNNWRPGDATHLLFMMIILLVPCATIAALTRQRKNIIPEVGDAGGLIGLISMLTIMVSIYHHFYDAIVLVVPMVGIILANKTGWSRISLVHRRVLLILILIPFLNYLSSKFFLHRFEIEGGWFTLITSINGVCLSFALAYATGLAILEMNNRRVVRPPARDEVKAAQTN